MCKEDVGKYVKLSGWVHRRRDHGAVLFIDLRDHYGFTQVVASCDDDRGAKLDHKVFDIIDKIGYESVITIEGKVVMRSDDNINKSLATGEIEVVAEVVNVISEAESLPMTINSEQEFPEETRLKYRFLDLRRDKLHNSIILRSQVIKYIRDKMYNMNFLEVHTPILTASSPEGARDFVVPSRLHNGKFYALPQAPQQFKQILMSSGFDRYFQIAPCFRDEDARADRAPGEFYQIDIEMAFATQEDVFHVVEPLMRDIFTEFSESHSVDDEFPRITYNDAMLKYGSDKPDLRNPIVIADVTDIFEGSGFTIFSKAISNYGSVIRAIPAPGAASFPRSFFDKMITFAQEKFGAKGLAYIIFDKDDGKAKGPIAKLLTDDEISAIKERSGINSGDAVFFACAGQQDVCAIAGGVRTHLGSELDIIKKDVFAFCWIIDFPFFEWNYEEKRIDFSHNPFSMPQGGLDALNNAKSKEDLLAIAGHQYDLVCNGIEISSGAIRNHDNDILYKAFEIVGYDKRYVDDKFPALVKAFSYGVPPHGGIAPGLDRIIMLLRSEHNIREVIAFPLNQKGQDLLMNAPTELSAEQLRELGITVAMASGGKDGH